MGHPKYGQFFILDRICPNFLHFSRSLSSICSSVSPGGSPDQGFFLEVDETKTEFRGPQLCAFESAANKNKEMEVRLGCCHCAQGWRKRNAPLPI